MNKIKKIIEELNLNIKLETPKLLAVNIVCITLFLLVYLFRLETYLYIATALLLVMVNYIFISIYISRYHQLLESREEELITLLSYLQVFIANHEPVYVAFKSLLTYSSNWMKDKIDRLLKDIDEDKSVLPFINFSKNFTSQIYESLCISIYQMIDEGENVNKINEFTYLFNEAKQASQLIKKQKYKRQLDILSSFPLFGAGIITIILTLSIISTIGGMSYVF